MTVLQFPSPKEHPVLTDNEAFVTHIASAEVSERTEASVADLIDAPGYCLPALALFPVYSFNANAAPRWGSAMMYTPDSPAGATEKLVVDKNFPRALLEQTGLGQQEAVDTAAIYVRSLDLIQDALRNTRRYGRKHLCSMPGSYNEAVWPLAFRRSPGVALPYRIAATVALHATDVQMTPQIPVRPSGMPPHIAGLLDPIPTSEEVITSDSFSAYGSLLMSHSKFRFQG